MKAPVVIVTGASRGLGAECARACAVWGARVVLSGRSGPELAQIADQISSIGGSATVLPTDVRVESDCRRLIGSTVEQFDRLDALVNNAGTLEPIQRVEHADPHEWNMNWRANILGPVMLSRAAIPALRRSTGRIINVSSGAAIRPIAGWGAYSLAKAALLQLTRILAVEEPAITVIAFRPGALETRMQAIIREKGAAEMEGEQYQDFVNRHEQGRLLPPRMPARSLAALALGAEREWSGEFIRWDGERVESLVSRTSNRDE